MQGVVLVKISLVSQPADRRWHSIELAQFGEQFRCGGRREPVLAKKQKRQRDAGATKSLTQMYTEMIIRQK